MDSLYNHIWVEIRNEHSVTDKNIALMTDYFGYQSNYYPDKNDSLNIYMRLYRLGEFFNPRITSALMIGGGGYLFPQDFLERLPKASIDVVEIDPKMTEIAYRYFNLKESPRLRTIHQDGRLYLKRSPKKYDVIYIDVYNTYFIPNHLLTLEFANELKNHLNPQGLVMYNLMSLSSNEEENLLSSVEATFRRVFNRIEIYNANLNYQTQKIEGNFMLVAFNNFKQAKTKLTPEWQAFLDRRIKLPQPATPIIFRDDYVPSDYLVLKGTVH